MSGHEYPSDYGPGTHWATHARDGTIRRDAYHRVLASAKTMTREMLIQWLEAEVAATP